MKIQARKYIIIEQVKQIGDIDLINAIQNLLDYALKNRKFLIYLRPIKNW